MKNIPDKILILLSVCIVRLFVVNIRIFVFAFDKFIQTMKVLRLYGI